MHCVEMKARQKKTGIMHILSRAIRLLLLDEVDAFFIVTPERQAKSAEQSCRTNYCWQSGDVDRRYNGAIDNLRDPDGGARQHRLEATVWKPKYSISRPRGESWAKRTVKEKLISAPVKPCTACQR